ncbi:type II toxin-antitoxin system HicA family toxin [Halobacterium sp. KA-4]|nr:type II toxin-antitoxin system HicA family toxin [Halobacterium sp. KA-4]
MRRGFLSRCAGSVFVQGTRCSTRRDGYQPVDRAGSHLKLRYVHPETDEIRNVTVPMGKEISGDTLRNIASQCGADDFQAWCNWIDDLL